MKRADLSHSFRRACIHVSIKDTKLFERDTSTQIIPDPVGPIQEVIEPFHIEPDLCPSQIATGILSLWGAGARNKDGGFRIKEEVAPIEQGSVQVVDGTTPAEALPVQVGEVAINADISNVGLFYYRS